VTLGREFEPPSDLHERVQALHKAGGYPRGDYTGWRCLNRLYTVAPGQWTVVTGTPQSGKSEFLDAMSVNLAEDKGWRFAVYSPENHPVETHVAKLAEKHARMPFGEGPTRPMNADECADATAWVLRHYHFIRPMDNDFSPGALVAIGMSYKPKDCARWGCILDPWNTLEHDRKGMSETDYVSHMLTHVGRMTREAQMHTWMVVHPKQLRRDRNGDFPTPHPYDISGSAHWFNKADNIICVHREKTEGNLKVEIHVQKVRFKHIGHIGLVELTWQPATGRYEEQPHVWDATAGKPERYA
jgi:twinkle protein